VLFSPFANGVADVLAKSLVLAHYETGIAAIFDRIEGVLQLLPDSPELGRVRHDLDGATRSVVVLR